ncbi:MAG: TonB family protein [Verrucomicrobiales bacterium]|nr:TonB family protein [Verrucomicrobiales bacterium]
MTAIVSASVSRLASRRTESVPAGRTSSQRHEAGASVVSALTLVLWTACLAVGGLGWWLPYPRPVTARRELPVVSATLLKVELTHDLLPVDAAQPSAAPAPSAPPPPAVDPTPVPAAPALVAVVEPSPKIAFELPVTGPVRGVPSAAASFAGTDEIGSAAVDPSTAATSGASGTGSGPAVETLSYGHGEGRQPAPEYPRQAVRERQQGTVLVRLTVGEHGRVLAAEAVSPSPWPLLNASAVRTVRERWRFPPGPIRRYEVPIRFELTQS